MKFSFLFFFVEFRSLIVCCQVSELKGEGLTISFVPGYVGKPTGKTEKAVVLDGYCRWESPVYETVKFVQDVKTCKVNQRIYHLILSTTVRSDDNTLYFSFKFVCS